MTPPDRAMAAALPALPALRVLPPRTYAPDSAWRQRWLDPQSTRHPAKMNAWLCRDLVLRYTRPGQTVLDPFGGIGTSLLGCTLGRNVLLVELESTFVALARTNWSHLRAVHRYALPDSPGLEWGWARIEQGDSRRLPFPSASCAVVQTSPPYARAITQGGETRVWRAKYGYQGANDGYSLDAGNLRNLPAGDVDSVIGSPPFGEMNAAHAGGNVTQRPAAGRNGWAGGREGFVYSEATPGQIGNLRYGDIAAAITSPPYGDVASRNRSQEPYAAAHPELTRAYGRGPDSPNRSVDGYGDSPGQLGREQGETYAAAVLQVYRECWRVTQPGGVLVLVTGNYVRGGTLVDLAAATIALCTAAGWTPLERWQACKTQISFWRRLHHQQRPDVPVVTSEDVLVFCKGGTPAWEFVELQPTTRRPVRLDTSAAPVRRTRVVTQAALPLDVETHQWGTGSNR